MSATNATDHCSAHAQLREVPPLAHFDRFLFSTEHLLELVTDSASFKTFFCGGIISVWLFCEQSISVVIKDMNLSFYKMFVKEY